jgi:hypothetical protein
VPVLGAIGALGPIAATLAWTVGGVIQHGYDPRRDDLSLLAAIGASHPWITMAGESILGFSLLALAAVLSVEFLGRRGLAGSAILGLAGVAAVVQALSREGCPSGNAVCAPKAVGTWQDTLHQTTSAIAFIAILLAPLILARPIGRGRGWQKLATASTTVAAVGFALLVVFIATSETSWAGLTERAFLLPPLVWIVAVGTRLAAAGPARRTRDATMGEARGTKVRGKEHR